MRHGLCRKPIAGETYCQEHLARALKARALRDRKHNTLTCDPMTALWILGPHR